MNKEEILDGNKLIARFIATNINFEFGYLIGREWFDIDQLKYHASWDWLMPVFDKFTSKFDISWKISSTMVNIYNPITNIDGRWEINCPENVIIDAWRGAVSTIKDINQNKLNEAN